MTVPEGETTLPSEPLPEEEEAASAALTEEDFITAPAEYSALRVAVSAAPVAVMPLAFWNRPTAVAVVVP